ncbi:MAG: glycosyltransferase family 4 protein [Candidatus Viridilinea halotolerans]|uniref:Glycosyltransferase family 4 protein n=1 Tax=Candidatus Viridilinea halotolerans TaxID=2491704 RepID=A0A426U8X8_9CHLR|nr:MAG: glycosyltransferase family 4 protein [Candidatus Viridilinea halotolerans]
MRILALSYEYPPLGGGGGVALAHSARAWAALGHQVTLVTSGATGLAAYEQLGSVALYRLPVLARHARATASLASLLSFPLAALNFVGKQQWQRSDFDLILSGFAIPSGVAGVILARAWRRPHVVWVMGGDAYDPSKRLSPHRLPLLKQTVAQVLNRSQAIITMSHDMAQRVAQIYRPATPIHVVPQGLALAPYAPQPRSGGPVTVVCVARLVRRKRMAELVQAVAELPPQSVRLIIVGEGPQYGPLQELIASHALSDRVQLVGYVSDEEKLALLRCADIFALVSEHEGFGLVYLEAAAQGLPIVAGRVGGQTDFLRHGVTGWLVAHDQPRQLKAALAALVAQPALRAWMGQQALQMAQRYEITRVADDFLKVLYDTEQRWKTFAA